MKLISPTCFIFFIVIFFNAKHLNAQNTIETTGDVLLFSVPTVALGSTLVLSDKQGTAQFAKGFLVNQAVTFTLKKIIDRERPNMQNNDSFPSGHTSTVFQGAAFIQQRYGWRYGAIAYLLASYTGFTRIHAQKHHFTDVLAGAIIGVLSSKLFTSSYTSSNNELSLNSNSGQLLFGLSYRF